MVHATRPPPPAAFRPNMMGLLTTVAELPHSYKMRYIKVESPLDLSVKQQAPLIIPVEHATTPSTSTPSARIEEDSRLHHRTPEPQLPQSSSMTPPRTPSPLIVAPTTESPALQQRRTTNGALNKRRRRQTKPIGTDNNDENIANEPIAKKIKLPVTPTPPTNAPGCDSPQRLVATMPNKPTKTEPLAGGHKDRAAIKPNNKSTTTVRRLKFDEYRSSPVSGTIIRTLEEIAAATAAGTAATECVHGDIDPKYNIVEVTDEVRAEIATIRNVIGGFECKLCRTAFADVFELARHRCSCIVLLDYRCPECGKRFNCPANLASHRRWHRPRDAVPKAAKKGALPRPGPAKVKKGPTDKASSTGAKVYTWDEVQAKYRCTVCTKSFKREAYLQKHLLSHSPDQLQAIGCDGEATSTPSAADDDEFDGLVIAAAAAAAADDASSIHSYKSDSAPDEDRERFDADGEDNNGSGRPADGAVQPQQHFRMFDGTSFTEEENQAAAALAHLRNGGPSVIWHTTVMA